MGVFVDELPESYSRQIVVVVIRVGGGGDGNGVCLVLVTRRGLFAGCVGRNPDVAD